MKEKKQLNKYAWYAIGSSIAFVVITLIVLIVDMLHGNGQGPNWSGGGNGSHMGPAIIASVSDSSSTSGTSGGIVVQPYNDGLSSPQIMAIVGFVLSVITLPVSVLGLYFYSNPARDGIFSAVFILHFVSAILSLRIFFILLIIACVFDSLYEGLSKKAAKQKEELGE